MVKKQTQMVIPDEIVMNKIYVLRGQKVMIDEDLAHMYQVETRRLNEQVKRNPDRFPEDFMFQLTETEYEILMSQNATSSWGGRRKLPNAFTELGVAMLSSVLNSPKAVQVNMGIMRIFTRIRQMLTDNTDLRIAIQNIEKKTDGNTKSIELLFDYIDELMEKEEKLKKPKPRKLVGFKLQKKK